MKATTEEKLATIDHFGGCPHCADHKNDGFLNIGRAQWFVCHAHKVKWLAGENLFRCWRDESRDLWRENFELLSEYSEVKPVFG
jgi:hypothetical protein